MPWRHGTCGGGATQARECTGQEGHSCGLNIGYQAPEPRLKGRLSQAARHRLAPNSIEAKR
eukprot:15475506-Alexandrium_andersonii.AAC.1